jgi:hypothetical protein
MKVMKIQILRIAGASLLGLVGFILLYTTYWHFHPPEPKYTLREALWVSDRDMTHFHPPFSAESLKIIEILEGIRFDPDKKAYSDYVLYRTGFTTKDPADEPILILGFRPPKD